MTDSKRHSDRTVIRCKHEALIIWHIGYCTKRTRIVCRLAEGLLQMNATRFAGRSSMAEMKDPNCRVNTGTRRYAIYGMENAKAVCHPNPSGLFAVVLQPRSAQRPADQNIGAIHPCGKQRELFRYTSMFQLRTPIT